jgi:hypothetical protein
LRIARVLLVMIVFMWEVIRITDDYSMLQCKTYALITNKADIFVIISKTYYALMTKRGVSGTPAQAFTATVFASGIITLNRNEPRKITQALLKYQVSTTFEAH